MAINSNNEVNLIDIITTENGITKLPKNYKINGSFYFLDYKNVYDKNTLSDFKYNKLPKINIFEKDIKKFYKSRKGSIIATWSSETNYDIFQSIYIDTSKPFVVNGFCKIINIIDINLINPKWLTFYLNFNPIIQKQRSSIPYTTRCNMTLNELKNIKIKIIPIENQQQIINIIEPFEKLKENLNKKIFFINDIAQDIIKTVSCRKKICELASVTAGQSPPQISKYWTNANIPFLNINNLTNNIYILSANNFINELAFKSYRCKKTTNYSILVGKVSPDKNKISVVNEGFVVNGAIRILEPLNIKDYGQIFESIRNESYKLSKIACGSVQQQINSNQLLNLEINFNIKFNIFFNIQLEYKKIQVRILDKIDKIINLLIQINIK